MGRSILCKVRMVSYGCRIPIKNQETEGRVRVVGYSSEGAQWCGTSDFRGSTLSVLPLADGKQPKLDNGHATIDLRSEGQILEALIDGPFLKADSPQPIRISWDGAVGT